MSLFMPTNVYPSKTGAVGNGTIDVSNDLTVSWQVNGSSAMTDFQIVICENDSLSTQVFDTGKLSDGCPFYGVNSKGEVQFFSYTIPSASLTTAGMANGNEYKLVITQWWSVSDSVTQSSASAFSTRTTPTVSIDAFADPLTERFATFTATYSQAEGDSIDWVRWQIANSDALDELLYDSDKIYGTSELSVSYDGFFAGNSYAVKCIVQTENGIEVNSGWEAFDVSYPVTAMTSAITAKMYGKHNAVEVNFSGAKYIPAISGGTYSLSDGKLVLDSGAYASWDTENTDPLEIGTPWTLLVKGSISNISSISSPFKAYMLDADGNKTGDNISLDVDSVLGTISVNASIGGESFNVLTANNAKNNSDFNLFVSPSAIALRVNSPTGGLAPSETLEPSNSLTPTDATGEQLEIISKNSAEYGFSLSAIYTIEVLGESVFDYIVAHKENFGADSEIYSEVIVNDTYEPEYLDSTAFFATFENSLEAGNYTGGGTIVGYSIYRLKVGETTLTHIIDVPKIKTTVIDYGASNQKEYQWYAFPITSSTFASTPLVSDPFRPCCWDWSILDCTLNEDGQYIVKKEYAFGKNLSSGTISNNNSPSIMQNFTQYPTVMQSSANYDSGSLTSLIGTIGRRSDGSYGYTDTLDLRQEIMNLSTTKDYLFLKSRKGDVNLIAISAPISVSITDNTIEQAQSVSIPWVKLDDAREYPIVQLPLESGEEDLVLFNVKALSGSTVVAFGNVKNTIARGDFTITNKHNTLFDEFNIYGTSEQEYFDGKNKLNYPMKAGNVTDGAIKEVTVSVSPKQDGTPWINSTVDTDPYTFRSMPSGADGANREYDKIVGGSVVWNQRVPQYTTATKSGVTLTNNGSGVLTASGTSTAGDNHIFLSGTSLIKGHKYLVPLGTLMASGGSAFIYLYCYSLSTLVYFCDIHASHAEFEIYTPDQDFTNVNYYLNIAGANRTFSGQIAPMLTDLTTEFGTTIADYVYSLEQNTAGSGISWLKSYGFFTKQYYAYSLPTIQSVSVSEKVTTGKNLFGHISTAITVSGVTYAWGADGTLTANGTSSGETGATNSAWKNNGYVTLPSGSYKIVRNNPTVNSGKSQNGWYLYDYDNGTRVTDITNTVQTFSLSAPTNVYLACYQYNAGYTNASVQIMLCSADVTDTAYVAYSPNTYSLSTTELRGIPSLVDGKLLYDGDEYSSSGTVTRKYGHAVLADLTWNPATSNRFYAVLPNGIADGTDRTDFIIVGFNPQASFADGNAWIYNGWLYVVDSTHVDVTSFVADLGTKDIVYPLETPTTESTTPFTNPQVIDEHGTESYTDYPMSQGTRDVAIPVGHKSNYALSVPVSGVDEVAVNVSGKNLGEVTRLGTAEGDYYRIQGYFTSGFYNTPIITCSLAAGTYTISLLAKKGDIAPTNNLTNVRLWWKNKNGDYLPNNAGLAEWRDDNGGTVVTDDFERVHITVTFTEDISTIYIGFYSYGKYLIYDPNSVMVNLGSTIEDYTPFVSSTTYTHSLSPTMFGGTVEMVSGVETTEMAEVDLSTLTWSYSSPTTSYPHGYFYARVTGKETGLTNFLSNTYQVVSLIQGDVDKVITGQGSGNRVYAVDSSFDNVADFVASLSGVKLIYTLATTTTNQGVGEDIETLDGENVISTDADSIVLRYGSGTTADSAALTVESQDALMVFNSTDMSTNGVSVTIDDDGYINASGTATREMTIVFVDRQPLGGSYTESSTGRASYKGTMTDGAIKLKASSGTVPFGTFTPSTDTIGVTLSAQNLYSLFMEMGQGDAFNATDIAFQIEEGTTVTDYEKYVGGYPLPSPDHPQPIKISDGTVTITGLDGVQTSQFSVRSSGDGYKVSGFFLGETIPQAIIDNPWDTVKQAVIQDKNGDYWYCDVIRQVGTYVRIKASNQFTLSISTTTQKNRWSAHLTLPNTYVTTYSGYMSITSEAKSLSNRFKFNNVLENIQDGEFYVGSDCFAIRLDSCATIDDFFTWTVTNKPEFVIAQVAVQQDIDPQPTPANPLSANARTIVTCDAESQPIFEVATYRSKYEGQLVGDTYEIQGGTGGAYLIEGDLNGTKTRERVVVADGSTTDVDLTS